MPKTKHETTAVLPPSKDLTSLGSNSFGTILADPPWQFSNRTGKMAPEHRRLLRYPTMSLQEIMELPVSLLAAQKSHLYLWVPNALVTEGLEVMRRWGFTYKTHIVWYKIRKDGGPDGRGVGFYFRNVTELLLFGVRGSLRTLPPGRRQVNIIATRKREHSRKPDEQYPLIESCSPGPYMEIFARHPRKNWIQWGNQIDANGLHKSISEIVNESISAQPMLLEKTERLGRKRPYPHSSRAGILMRSRSISQ